MMPSSQKMNGPTDLSTSINQVGEELYDRLLCGTAVSKFNLLEWKHAPIMFGFCTYTRPGGGFNEHAQFD